MKKNEKFYDLEQKIRSLPKPDYDKKFTKETQDIIHENLIQLASSYDKKKKRTVIMKKISLGLASIAAFVLFAILIIPAIGLDSNQQGQQGKGEPTVDNNNDKEGIDQNEPEENHYDNTEYGFTFTLPDTWEGYQIVSDSWEGIATDQQQTENGQILLIRHPEWTEEKPRQDIPIMIFTLRQWSSLEKGEFHIGAAPIGPTLLGQNNEYVFALPARYNFAFLEGYEEVENILENNPLQPKNVVK
ncbi:hypothetical protein ACIQAA_25790 [Neobacillus sp. NPDC093182]|uniref:hypothetical protein n=1 Tax=Neobacillus sp. NPDC093182 TaxID=3364297 RepID=UPI00381A9B81